MVNRSDFEERKSSTLPSNDKEGLVDKFVQNSAFLHKWKVLVIPDSRILRLELSYHSDLNENSDKEVAYQTVVRELGNSQNFDGTVIEQLDNGLLVKPSFSSRMAREYDKKDDDTLF